MKPTSLAAVGLALALAACASRGPAPAASAPVPATLPLLAPAALGAPRTAQQVLRGAFGTREATMQCGLSLDAARLRLACVNPLGLRLLSLSWDGVALDAETAPGTPPQVEPARVLADVQLAYAPLAAWQARLAGTPWRVSEPAPATRRLHRDGRLVAEVHYAADSPWSGRLWISNFEFGYSLALEMQP